MHQHSVGGQASPQCLPSPALVFVLFVLSLSHAQTCWCSVHYFPTAFLESNQQMNVDARVCCPTYRGLVSFCTSNNKCKCVYSNFLQSVLCHCRSMQLKPGEPACNKAAAPAITGDPLPFRNGKIRKPQ